VTGPQEPARTAPGAELVGREVCSTADGHLIGLVEETRHLDYRAYGAEPPEADVVMVRHLHGDGQLRAYELGEVRERIAEGRVVAAPEAETEPEAELEP
jgi:hypothetical protein